MSETTRTKGRAAPEPEPLTLAAPLQLVFAIPGSDEPGFIRRQRTAMQLTGAFKAGGGVQAMDDMINFLLTFVAEPQDREQARELLYDLSRDDYNGLLQAVLRESEDFLP